MSEGTEPRSGGDTDPWSLFQSAAEGAMEWDDDQRAERLFLAALREAERAGPDDQRLQATLGRLIDPYQHRTAATERAGAAERAAAGDAMEHMGWRLLALEEGRLGPGDAALTPVLERLALGCTANDEPLEAEALYRRRLAIEEQTEGPESMAVVDALIDLALHLQGTGRGEEEEQLWRRALAISEQHAGPASPKPAQLLAHLAELYVTLGRPADATAALRRALALEEGRSGADSNRTRGYRDRLASVYVAQRDFASAEPLLRAVVANLEASAADEDRPAGEAGRRAHGRDLERQGQDEDRLEALQAYEGVLRALGRVGEADGIRARSVALRATAEARARRLAEVAAVEAGG